MSLASLLDHTVVSRRQSDAGTEDDYGQPVLTTTDSAAFAAAIQPKGAREMIVTAQDGAPVGDHRVYCATRDLLTGDAIVHDPTSCGKAVDLPSAIFEIVTVRNAVGRGHHLELDCRLVGPAGIAVLSEGS